MEENKLFVGNVPFSTTEDELREIFATAGTVTSVRIVLDRDTHRSRGFAFVEMADAQGVAKAEEALNGHELEGRALLVSKARPQDQSNGPRRDFNRNSRGGNGGGHHRDFNRGGYDE